MNISEGLRLKPLSAAWESAELRLLQRCFDMKLLKRLTKGPRKNQIEIDRPKWSATVLDEDGVLAAHICAHAYVAWQRHVEIFCVSPASEYLEIYGTPSIADVEIDKTVSIIGLWLNVIARVWNELGKQWPDLWDVFDGPEQEHTPFLQFYRLCQEIRPSIHGHRETEMQKALMTALGKSQGGQRLPFENDGPEQEALRAIGVAEESIQALPKILRQWQATRADWEDYREQIKSVDSEVTESLGAKSRVSTVKTMLKSNRAVLKVNQNLPTGMFTVETIWQTNSLSLQPVILVGNLERLGEMRALVGLHEYGHCILHSSWQAELSLMRAVRDRVRAISPQTGNLIGAIINERSTSLSAFYSALEQAADEFALSIVLTDVDLEKLKNRYTDKDGSINVFALRNITDGLGLFSRKPTSMNMARYRDQFSKLIDEHMARYRDRFSKLVNDHLQSRTIFDPKHRTTFDSKLMPTRDLRAAMHGISGRRVELLLETLWREICEILKGKETVTASRTRRAGRSMGFSFDGITC